MEGLDAAEAGDEGAKEHCDDLRASAPAAHAATLNGAAGTRSSGTTTACASPPSRSGQASASSSGGAAKHDEDDGRGGLLGWWWYVGVQEVAQLPREEAAGHGGGEAESVAHGVGGWADGEWRRASGASAASDDEQDGRRSLEQLLDSKTRGAHTFPF